MLKKILLLVFCLVFASMTFSQVFEQFKEIRENKVVKVHVGDKDRYTISIEHSPNEMYVISPSESLENDTFYNRYFIRDKDMLSFDSVYSVSKYGYMQKDTFVDYYKTYNYYDSLSRVMKAETLLDDKLQSVELYKYNDIGKLDSFLIYNFKRETGFGTRYGESLQLYAGYRYEYDSLERQIEEVQFRTSLYHKSKEKYLYDENDELVEVQCFDGFSRRGSIIDSRIKHYTFISYEDDENGLLKSRKSRKFSLKNDKDPIGSETFDETHYEYLENGLLTSEINKYFTLENGKKTMSEKYKITYNYDFFTYDIYKPLDAENTKADTTDKIPIVENELISLLHEFDWSAYPAYPTVSVYHNSGESTLWVAKYAESDDDDKLEMFILGYHENIEKRAFFGLGKKRIKERKNIYMAVGFDNVKMLYQLYFAGKTEMLKSKLRTLDKEIKF